MAEESTRKPNRRSERIGKYEIIEHIASGGMGIVYKARDPDLDRYVALKILSPDLAKQTTTLIRFQREARAAALLRHDNIVAIYEIGEASGAHFIALEYVDGYDLQAYISRKARLHPDEARLLVIQATRALVHAHEQGIVHRDIKPSNFLLQFKDNRIILKLTDFGLAIRNENDAEFRITRDKTTVGTVDYMSPEQARDSRSADIRSDIYSLGCTFYHMLGGAAPFARGTLPERIVQHMQAPAPDVRKLNRSVPAALVAIIQRMLAKKPDDRYQTPAELLHDLENLDQVEVPDQVKGVAGRGHHSTRKAKSDVTSVIEAKDLDTASAEPAQVKSTRPKRTPPAGIEDPTNEVDDPIVVPVTDHADERADTADEETKPRRARTKRTSAAGSPIWIYAVAGAVAVLGAILVAAFAIGSRPPREVEAPSDEPPIAINLDKKVEVPVKPTIGSIDTSPEKMTVLAPALPIMDLEPAKADQAALRKEYYGGFETFPGVPAQANHSLVRRLSIAGSAAHSHLAEALAQTKADQFNVIEIADNGPIVVSTLPTLSKRTVLLRGAAGFRPLLVWELPKKPADPKAAATFLELSSGRLILDNIDFVMNAAADAPVTVFDMPDGDFFARDCTFSLGGKSAQGIALVRRAKPNVPVPAEARKTQTWLQRCYVRGPDALLLRHHESSAEVLLEQSLIVGYQHPLLSIRARDEDFAALHCVRSTLVTGHVLVRLQSSDAKGLNPQFHGRILDTILSRDDPTAPAGDLLQVLDGSDTNRMTWKASNSVYAGWKQLLASAAKNIVGHDLNDWHRQWAYSLGDRVVAEAWPSSPPSSLDELSASTFLPVLTPLAYSALTGSGAVGCVVGRLPSAPENWRERTLEPRQAPVIANIDVEVPRINSAEDGMYHGERLDLTKVDLGAYLSGKLQKFTPAPRVVMHLTGKGVCTTSPLRVKGVQHLTLYFEPAKDPLILEGSASTLSLRSPLIEMTGGHLEMIGARIRLSQATLIPSLIHVQAGHLTLSRCWLTGPLSKAPDPFKSLITVANPTSSPATLLLRENVLVSGKLLIHAKENVEVKARNNVLVSLGDGVLFDNANLLSESVLHHFDHNTWAVRQTYMQLRPGPDSSLGGSARLHVSNNAFVRPFDGDLEKSTLTRGFELWSATGRLTWQGSNNVYDARMPAFHLPGGTKAVGAKQTLKDWQQAWGQAGEYKSQVLETTMATRDLALEGAKAGTVFGQLERLVLPRQVHVDVTQSFPGADLFTLGIQKKKGA